MKAIIDWANANNGFVGAVLTFVYVTATLWLVALARRQLCLATELERSRTRPFVIFDLILDPPCFYAVAHNIGQTPAYKVRITSSPTIECLLGGEGMVPATERVKEIAFISRGIAMLAPQRSITGLFGQFRRVKAAHPALRFEGKVSYRGPDGVEYSEPFAIDLSVHEGLLRRGTKGIEDMAKHLEEIAREVRHIGSGFSKPLVRTVTEAEYRAEQEAFVAEAEAVFQAQQAATEQTEVEPPASIAGSEPADAAQSQPESSAISAPESAESSPVDAADQPQAPAISEESQTSNQPPADGPTASERA